MSKEILRVYAGPSRYVQGRGAFSRIGKEIQALGVQGKAFIVASKSAEQVSRSLWEPSLKEAEIDFSVCLFGGECSDAEIERIKTLAELSRADFFIAIGGGKVLDAARAAAEILCMETIVCPSIASTDAPCIALSVIYSEEGEMERFCLHRKNPILVLVDTEVIARAPKRFLISGMGDALATYYEARTCKNTYAVNPRGGLQTEAGLALARLCRDILLEDGVEVASSYEIQGITPAFERIVEANVLLSGMGVELCHVAGAHAIHNGLTKLKETRSCYHGEKVAFGLITQLVLEGEKFEEIHRLLRFYKEVGLPSTFTQLGISDASEQRLLEVAHRATKKGETMAHEPFPISPKDVVDAMRFADSLGQSLNKK